ncbi:unnamed protein product [Durusdinium trenchii]|uniref:RRM domain-containing protein n=1 Tax=Durusdinium trenchii TaxID=1381693 RepID=A0ABP0NDQ3_9DINO
MRHFSKKKDVEDLRSVVSFAGDEFELDLYHPVGQLASSSSGLLLWSRSGRVTKQLQDLRRGVVRVLEVEVWGTVQSQELHEALSSGVPLGVSGFNRTYSANVVQEACLVPESPLQELRSRVLVSCSNGRANIPAMIEKCGYKVAAVKQVQVGGFSLGQMQEGQLQAATPEEEAFLFQSILKAFYLKDLRWRPRQMRAEVPEHWRHHKLVVTMSDGAHKIFVGGLPQDCPQEMLSDYFGKFGNITDVVVMTDRMTGRCRGFGFVTFDTADAVEAVMGQHGEHQILGKWVDCKRATREGSKGRPDEVLGVA